ncbi:MAG: hypothetical protein JNL66_13190, partial [Alphaproteobacteria bacterium]|nr:hypothetical protein [Alphaproteobacteria bacterium]
MHHRDHRRPLSRGTRRCVARPGAARGLGAADRSARDRHRQRTASGGGTAGARRRGEWRRTHAGRRGHDLRGAGRRLSRRRTARQRARERAGGRDRARGARRHRGDRHRHRSAGGAGERRGPRLSRRAADPARSRGRDRRLGRRARDRLRYRSRRLYAAHPAHDHRPGHRCARPAHRRRADRAAQHRRPGGADPRQSAGRGTPGADDPFRRGDHRIDRQPGRIRAAARRLRTRGDQRGHRGGDRTPGADDCRRRYPERGDRAVSNQLSGAEALVRMLKLHGVDTVFGLCGDTSLPFYDALYRTGQGITHVLTRDERSAAYMADGYARVTGKVGVCEGPSGGGATYILPGVVEANESSIPILAITTDVSVAARGRFTLTELDQEALFRPLAKWNRVIDRAADLPRTVRAAFAQMTTGRAGAAHLGLPLDVQRDAVDEAEIWADAAHGRYPARRVGPDPASVETLVALLARAERPIFICGGGVVISGAEAALQRVAERLDAAVATTISGQGSISERHPLAVGVVGSNGGTPETRALVD